MANDRPKDLQKLFDKRDNLIGAIKFHAKKIDEITDDQQIEAFSRLCAFENAFEKFTAASDSLEDHEDFCYSDLTIKNEDIVDIFIKRSAKLRMITKELHDSSLLNSTANARPVNPSIEVKLPQITIPTFDGNYEEWTSFHDAFVSLVDSNTNLSDVNKMHYLRSCLKGDALKVIHRLPVTEANYKIACKQLIERFQHKRIITNKCLNSLINQPAMQTRNASELRSLTDTVKESLQCIESLDIMTDEWNPFVIFIAQSKMDTVTRGEWEEYLGGSTTIPKMKILYTFLETQFRILDGSNINQSSVNNTNFHPAASTSSQNETRANLNENFRYQQTDICLVCSDNHWVLNCPKFHAWTPVQRKNFAIQNGICIVCLHVHDTDKCKSTYRCKKCNGPHSFKLHTENDDLPHVSSQVSTLLSDYGKHGHREDTHNSRAM